MGPPLASLPASKTRINRAGDALRRAAVESGGTTLVATHREDLDLVRAYRAAHAYPLKAVTMALRHHARRAASGSWLDIGQRLKQLSTITDKLARMQGMNLARMQDIGGCRATFLDQAIANGSSKL